MILHNIHTIGLITDRYVLPANIAAMKPIVQRLPPDPKFGVKP